MGQEGKADKPRSGTPFEQAVLPRQTSAAEKPDEILPEIASAAIQESLVVDVNIAVSHLAVRAQPTKDPPEPPQLGLVRGRSYLSRSHDMPPLAFAPLPASKVLYPEPRDSSKSIQSLQSIHHAGRPMRILGATIDERR
jgi:hypothetical protein